MSTTWAASMWASMAAEGWRYDNGFMTRGDRYVPVPKRERKAAKAASAAAAAATN
jgi:hypothetical protein